MEKEVYTTQIRLSGKIADEIFRISDETGISRNATMQMLMALGIKVYSSEFKIQCQTNPAD